MALPFSFSSELKWSDHVNNMHGPFENGTDLYAVLLDKTNNTLEVWKSTDGGNSWSEQDSGNHKTITTSTNLRSCYVVKVGTILHIAFSSNNVPTFNIVPFDMSTDTYGTVILNGPGTNNNVSGFAPFALVVRSDGSYIVFHNGVTETVMGTARRRVKYSRYASGSWTLNTDVGGLGSTNDLDADSAIIGSSDRSHLFWRPTTISDANHVTLTSANVLQTTQLLNGSVNGVSNFLGIPFLNGSEVLTSYKESATGGIRISRGTSADNPTWTEQTINATTVLASTSNHALVVDGSTVYAFWGINSDSDLWYNNDGGVGTWGSDIELKDAITLQGINVTKITNAFGILYVDNGTVKYDKFQLVFPKTRPWRPTRWHYANRRSMF